MAFTLVDDEAQLVVVPAFDRRDDVGKIDVGIGFPERADLEDHVSHVDVAFKRLCVDSDEHGQAAPAARGASLSRPGRRRARPARRWRFPSDQQDEPEKCHQRRHFAFIVTPADAPANGHVTDDSCDEADIALRGVESGGIRSSGTSSTPAVMNGDRPMRLRLDLREAMNR